jgi:hypothetical protein
MRYNDRFLVCSDQHDEVKANVAAADDELHADDLVRVAL